jgi:dTDP-4-amino-4,6-dideoxygalactose transaminase
LAEKSGVLPKVVVPVHLCGQSAEMEAIHKLSLKYNFKVIEDASHAIGGKYKAQPVGNCKYSDITIFSFHPVKIITTGEGGMALTNKKCLADKMRLLRSHGITRNAQDMTHHPDGDWYYQQIDLGFNYRMSDIHAALGVSQIKRLDSYVARRNKIAQNYLSALEGLPLSLPYVHPDAFSAYHLYVIRLNPTKILNHRKSVFNSLRDSGIGVNVHYIPVHLQPYYQNMGFKSGAFVESEQYYASAISLPIFPAMTEDQQCHVINSLRKSLAE